VSCAINTGCSKRKMCSLSVVLHYLSGEYFSPVSCTTGCYSSASCTHQRRSIFFSILHHLNGEYYCVLHHQVPFFAICTTLVVSNILQYHTLSLGWVLFSCVLRHWKLFFDILHHLWQVVFFSILHHLSGEYYSPVFCATQCYSSVSCTTLCYSSVSCTP